MKPVALVTGARRGIGLGIAKALASKGFDLAITDIVDDAASQSAIKALEKLGAKAVFIQSDIADLSSHGRDSRGRHREVRPHRLPRQQCRYRLKGSRRLPRS